MNQQEEKINETINDYLNRIASLHQSIDERNEWILADSSVGFLVEHHQNEISRFECQINFYKQEIHNLSQ